MGRWDAGLGDLKRRLLENSLCGDEKSCWNWKGKTARGYGKINLNKKSLQANRASWMVHFGDIPAGLLVCHKCDNRRCINPYHLYLGTYKENSNDRSLRYFGANRAGKDAKMPKGVYAEKSGRFSARRYKISLGTFDTVEEAVAAWVAAGRPTIMVCDSAGLPQIDVSLAKVTGKKTSVFRGVRAVKGGKWNAYVHFEGKRIELGRFDCEGYAAMARDIAARKYLGPLATLNFDYPEGAL